MTFPEICRGDVQMYKLWNDDPDAAREIRVHQAHVVELHGRMLGYIQRTESGTAYEIDILDDEIRELLPDAAKEELGGSFRSPARARSRLESTMIAVFAPAREKGRTSGGDRLQTDLFTQEETG